MEGFGPKAENPRLLYVPKGFAQHFQRLRDGVEARYMIKAFDMPEAASRIRNDDPAFAITWPLPPAAISERHRAWPDSVIPPARAAFHETRGSGQARSRSACSSRRRAALRITANGMSARSAMSSSECVPSDRFRTQSIAIAWPAPSVSPPMDA
jgi:hypothetical protein